LLDHLVRRQLHIVERNAHDATDEGSSSPPHAFDLLRFPLEFESARFTRTATEAHHALVETSPCLWRKPRSDSAN
jgi:hypothetical protein